MKTLTNLNQLSAISGGNGMMATCVILSNTMGMLSGGVGGSLVATGIILSNTTSMAYGEGIISYDTYLTSMIVSTTLASTGTACLYLQGCRDGKNMTKSVINTVLDIF